MRANCNIVSGNFQGGIVEPGTFHHWYPTHLLPSAGAEKGPGSDGPVTAAAEGAAAVSVISPEVSGDADIRQEVANPQA